jgi:hypothetical protein
MLTVTVQDAGRVIRWTGTDFVPRTDARPSTPEVNVGRSGPDLVVTFRLETGGVLLSAGTITLPRRSDWRWGVILQAATEDPTDSCFGCIGSKAFLLAEAFRVPARDSIWVYWAGNSINNPVIY